MKKHILYILLLFSTVLTISGAKKPKYIFYFIGDGMGMSPVLCAETYNRTVIGNGTPLLMLQFPTVSMATSYSASHTITDSAAAGTALATGHKTNNGMIGMAPDSTNLSSIAYELKKKGYGIAIATSVAPDDATPAAFYAHTSNRTNTYDITIDMARSNFDMFAGGRLRGKAPEGKPDVEDILNQAGYKIIHGPTQWNEHRHGNKVLLLNSPYHNDHIGYAIDSIPGNLTLPFITQACIEHMNRVSPKQFFIMVEGGLIDHGLHPNDTGASIIEIINFNHSLQHAYDFYLKHPDETLIIVTADHNTGGMTAGVSGGPYNLQMKNISYQRISLQNMQHDCRRMINESKDSITWDDMKTYISNKLGLYATIPVSDKDDATLKESFRKTFLEKKGAKKQTLYVSVNHFVESAFHIFDRTTGIGWTTLSHTADFVPVYAIGVGSEQFQGFMDNTDIPAKIRSICGIKE